MKNAKVTKRKSLKNISKIIKKCQKNISYIKQLHALGCSDFEIAEALGIKEADLYLYANC